MYSVTLRGKVENQTLDRMRALRELDGEEIAGAEVELVSRNETQSVVKFTLSEGKNREIRRICEAVGEYVLKLKRISLGPLQLGDLKTGEYRELKPSAGRIQLQSEGFGIEYRNIVLEPVD